MPLTLPQIKLLLLALNDREGVLCGDWERAQRASPGGALATQVSRELSEVRALANSLAAQANRLETAPPRRRRSPASTKAKVELEPARFAMTGPGIYAWRKRDDFDLSDFVYSIDAPAYIAVGSVIASEGLFVTSSARAA